MLFTLFSIFCMQIYVVDSLDRERIGKAKAEFQVTYSRQFNTKSTPFGGGLSHLRRLFLFQAIIRDPFMLNSVILVFANKQDMVCWDSDTWQVPLHINNVEIPCLYYI